MDDTLYHVTMQGPAYPFGWELSVTHFSATQQPFFKALPWRRRLAWRLRLLADRLDQGFSISYAGDFPPGVTMADFPDALSRGALEMTNYLADLSRDRSI